MAVKIQRKHLTIVNKDGTIAEVPAIVSSGIVPEGHASSHAAGGSDPVTLESIGALSSNVGLSVVNGRLCMTFSSTETTDTNTIENIKNSDEYTEAEG